MKLELLQTWNWETRVHTKYHVWQGSSDVFDKMKLGVAKFAYDDVKRPHQVSKLSAHADRTALQNHLELAW